MDSTTATPQRRDIRKGACDLQYGTFVASTGTFIANREEVAQTMRDARRFLVNQQADADVRGETDNSFDGGIGYGGRHPHSDMSNTHLAMEALSISGIDLVEVPNGQKVDWKQVLSQKISKSSA